MFKKIKMYFAMKRLSRQMKYELLSKVYLMISEKENLFQLFSKLASEASTMDSKELMDKFISAMAELAHETAQKEKAIDTNEE